MIIKTHNFHQNRHLIHYGCEKKIDFILIFINFYWFSLIFHWFSLIFIDFHWFSVQIQPLAENAKYFLGQNRSKNHCQNTSKKKNFHSKFHRKSKNDIKIFGEKNFSKNFSIFFSLFRHFPSPPAPRWKCISIFLGQNRSKNHCQNPSKKKISLEISPGIKKRHIFFGKNQKNIFFSFFAIVSENPPFSFIFHPKSIKNPPKSSKILQNLCKIIQNDNKNA